MDRRDFVRVAAVGSLGLPVWLSACAGSGGFGAGDPLEMAKGVARWLRSQRIESRGGYTWPRLPEESAQAGLDLWSGTPGIILFLVDLHHATGDPTYLEEALEAAYLLQGAYLEGGGWPRAAGSDSDDPSLDHPGLYTGWAGAAFTLAEVYHATGADLHRTGALTLFDAVLSSAQVMGDRRAWYLESPDEARYDIMGGSAGMGLALLYAHERLDFPSLEGAMQAGRYLLDRARPADVGQSWPTREADDASALDFARGTAGVSYFLARLAEATDGEEYLDGALAGARHIRSVVSCGDDGCRVAGASAPPGWLDGVAGYARLCHRLWSVTGDEAWRTDAVRFAQAAQRAVLSGERHETLGGEASLCCGAAGVGELFTSFDAMEDPAGSLAAARRLARSVMDRATRGEDGAYWRQTERVDGVPRQRVQTGWMEGAAGIGAFLVHLDGVEQGRARKVVLPG